jgi:SAM-dependent MidA family methyltransferase
VPDGQRDITAHVALDACAHAGRRAGASATTTVTQQAALKALGVRTVRPPRTCAATDVAGYLRALEAAADGAAVSDPAGLGSHTWLVQSVACPLPTVLR